MPFIHFSSLKRSSVWVMRWRNISFACVLLRLTIASRNYQLLQVFLFSI